MTVYCLPLSSCWSGHIPGARSFLFGDCEWLRNSLVKCVQMDGSNILCSQPVCVHIWYANQIMSAASATGHLIGYGTDKWI